MDFKKRLIEELKLTKLQVDTMYNDYVEVCEKLAKEYHKEQLILPKYIIEIDFDGHLKCQIETTDKSPIILKAVNGYGGSVDCSNGNIRITNS